MSHVQNCTPDIYSMGFFISENLHLPKIHKCRNISGYTVWIFHFYCPIISLSSNNHHRSSIWASSVTSYSNNGCTSSKLTGCQLEINYHNSSGFSIFWSEQFFIYCYNIQGILGYRKKDTYKYKNDIWLMISFQLMWLPCKSTCFFHATCNMSCTPDAIMTMAQQALDDNLMNWNKMCFSTISVKLINWQWHWM